jgi:sialidase-1
MCSSKIVVVLCLAHGLIGAKAMRGIAFKTDVFAQKENNRSVPPPVSSVPVFTQGEDGYAAFRIPGLLAVNNTVLAFAEGRKFGCGDFDGQHDIVFKRSIDGGRTFGDLHVLLDPYLLFGQSCANRTSHTVACMFWDPTPVYDRSTGRVIMMTTLSRTQAGRYAGELSAWTLSSKDLGSTWDAAPRNISSQVWSDQWRMGTPSNGHGIQLASGRLLMPVYVRIAGDGSEKSSTFFSDDHGQSWHFGGGVVGLGTSESEVVELFHAKTPTLLFNHRRNRANQANSSCDGKGGHPASCRWQSISTDGGASWGGFKAVPQLEDPSCKGGIAGWPEEKALLFSNDASTSGRVNISLRVSHDDGATWSKGLLISAKGGYTDVQLVGGAKGGASRAGVVYEAGGCSIRLALADPRRA